MGTWLKRIGLGALALVVLCTVAVFAVDAHVRSSAGPRIVSVDEAAALGDVDCVLVLGCGVHPDGRPSDMLADRVACGVALYENGTSPKLLMSGDHGRADYDEVNVMRNRRIGKFSFRTQRSDQALSKRSSDQLPSVHDSDAYNSRSRAKNDPDAA